mmetsp:Transcript_21045/g.31899  ORF Transcript_21045/g.31899 Transcript_21045/m.31899 type:complete len:209 (+) Transcript_21045:702-1328(+)
MQIHSFAEAHRAAFVHHNQGGPPKENNLEQCITLLQGGHLYPMQLTSHFPGLPLACRQTEMYSFAKAYAADFFCTIKEGCPGKQCLPMHVLVPTHPPPYNVAINAPFSCAATGMPPDANAYCPGSSMHFLAPIRLHLPNTTNFPFFWATTGMPPNPDAFFCQGPHSCFLLPLQRRTVPSDADAFFQQGPCSCFLLPLLRRAAQEDNVT